MGNRTFKEETKQKTSKYRTAIAVLTVSLLLALFLCSFHPTNTVEAHYPGASIECAPLSVEPVIDGVYSNGEYADTTRELLDDGGDTHWGYFKNDEDYLYFLFEVPSTCSYHQNSFLAFGFDTGHDLVYAAGHDDEFMVGDGGVTYHSTSDGFTTLGDGGVFYANYTEHCSPFDDLLPGHQGLAAATDLGRSPYDPIQLHRMFEFKIPLALLQASEGDTIGLAFDGVNRDGMNGWQWPVHQSIGGSRPLADYGNIVLASYKSLWDTVHDAKGTVRWVGPHTVGDANIKASRNLDSESLEIVCGICTEIGGELEDPRQDGWLLVELETSPEKYEYFAITLQPHARADFWPMAGHDPSHNGRSLSTVPTNNSTRWNYTAAGAIQFSPAVADDMVFLGSPTEIRTLNATTGDPIWQFTRTVTSSPAVANGRVFFGAADGLYALNETTGTVAWRFQTTASVNCSPIVCWGMVIFGCDNNYVYALNETDKSVIWSFLADGPVRTSPNNPPYGLADPRPTPYAIFGSATTMYAVNITSGAFIWSCARQVCSSPTVADSRVFFGSGLGLYALNMTTGTEIWRYSTGSPVYSTPAVADGVVFFGCNNHYIYALNATDKAVVWSDDVGEEIKASPVVAGNLVIWGYSWTKGECRDKDTGELKWEFGTSGDIDASPVLAYGNVYFGDMNGKLYSVGPEYNVASISLEPTKTVVGENRNVFMNATVTNLGEVGETFHVGIECEEGMIGEVPVTLAPSESTVVRFRWNATYTTKGNYTLRAVVDSVPGETDGTDNTVSGGWIVVSIPGDVDGNFNVNIFDVVKITGCYGKTRGDPIFYPNADIDENGVISIFDVVVCTGHYGQKWP